MMFSYRAHARTLLTALSLTALVGSAAGCDDPAEPAVDAFTPRVDAGVTTEPDAGPAADPDAGPVADPDAGPVADPDAGPVVIASEVTLTYGDESVVLDRTYLGFASTDGVRSGIYLELSRNHNDVCPSETAPTPDQIITVDAIALTAPGTVNTGIEARFFDFEGLLRDELRPAFAESATVTLSTLDESAGVATGEIELHFEGGGSAIGTFHALHCPSLDVDSADDDD